MNKIEYLLVCLSEETSEIGKEACKANRFGPFDEEPGSDPPITNSEKIVNEVNDLLGIMQMLSEEGVIPPDWKSDHKIEHKIKRTKKYMAMSQKLGRLK